MDTVQAPLHDTHGCFSIISTTLSLRVHWLHLRRQGKKQNWQHLWTQEKEQILAAVMETGLVNSYVGSKALPTLTSKPEVCYEKALHQEHQGRFTLQSHTHTHTHLQRVGLPQRNMWNQVLLTPGWGILLATGPAPFLEHSKC